MRTLRLKKEALSLLTPTELTGVVGAAATQKECGPTLSLTCTSEVDACLTARGCWLTRELC